MGYFAFDRWPIELIFMIFQYLPGNEILFTFRDTSSYMNRVLNYYNKYSFNFMSITKEKFDLILSSIELNKVFSLTLSNGELTPGQFGLFLSRYSFSFYLFPNLLSLTLHSIKIKQDEYQHLIKAFKHWKNLRLLHLQQISLANIDDHFTTVFDQLDRNCLVKLDHCEQLNIIPLSERLLYWRSNYLYNIDNNFYRHQWPCLRTVVLKDLWRTSINHLFHLTPELLSLTVECEINKNMSLPNFRLVPKLKHLVFSSQNLTLKFLTTETGFNTLSELKQLEIKCNVTTDELLFDGHQWETLLSQSFPHLTKFDFHFKSSAQKNLSLNTFRTEFWLDEKKWYVALRTCQYSNHLELFTVPRFNTTIKISKSIIDTTSSSFEHLTSNIDVFSNSSLIDKNNNYDISSHRYEHITKFDYVIQNGFDHHLYLLNKLNYLLHLNSIKIVQIVVMHSWLVNYQHMFDLLDQMPNVFKIILDTWPKKDSWLQIKKGNTRITSIELPLLHKVNDERLPSGLKPIFSHLFLAIEHVYIRVHCPELCHQFDRFSLPWKSLSSLQIEYLFIGNSEEDQERRFNEWKDKFLHEILPEQAQRTFTYTDINNKLSIWFGELLSNQDEIIQTVKIQSKKKTVRCFPSGKCFLS